MKSSEQQLPQVSPEQKPIKVNPQENHKKRLAMFGDVLKLVRGRKKEVVSESTTATSWTELYKEVPPFESALELNNGVRNAVDNLKVQILFAIAH